jgi:hypothetical protein
MRWKLKNPPADLMHQYSFPSKAVLADFYTMRSKYQRAAVRSLHAVTRWPRLLDMAEPEPEQFLFEYYTVHRAKQLGANCPLVLTYGSV